GIGIGVRAFFKGFQAAAAARLLAWKIGALDAALARRTELAEQLNKLHVGIVELLSRVDKVDSCDNLVPLHIRRFLSSFLRGRYALAARNQDTPREEGEILEEVSGALRHAYDYMKDLRDERPMRLAAAAHSSREAQNDIDPRKAEAIRREIR